MGKEKAHLIRNCLKQSNKTKQPNFIKESLILYDFKCDKKC